MRFVLLISLTILTGCRSVPDVGEQKCEGVPFKVKVMEPGNELLCDRLLFYSEQAKETLDKNGVLSADEYYATFEGVTVNIYNSAWLMVGPSRQFGNYYAGIISLNFDGRSLLHEMLHHLDLLRFNVMSSQHDRWDMNNYNKSVGELDGLPFTNRFLRVNVAPIKEQNI